MYHTNHLFGCGLWRMLALLAFLATSAAATAAVTTSGCTSQTYCTGAELGPGSGEFTIDGVRFYNFIGVGIFDDADVRFIPYDDAFNPGFLVTRDGGQPLYRAAGVPVDNTIDGVVFDVESLDDRAILRRSLIAAIGEYADPVSAYIGTRTYSNSIGGGGIDLAAICYDVLACANSNVRIRSFPRLPGPSDWASTL